MVPLKQALDVDDSDDDFSSSELVGSVKMIVLMGLLNAKDSEFDDSDLVESDTLWQDKITSVVRTGNFHLTQKVNTIRIEYILPGLPSIWPILRTCTVFVINLDDPKYIIRDPQTGDFYTIDTLIRNADNDSWKSGGSGSGSSLAQVTFAPVRYKLDPASHDAVLAAQAETHRNEGTTAEQFKKVVWDAKCTAIDSHGNRCKGSPMMKAKPAGTSCGHHYFITCSGWRQDFKENHRTHLIPDHVDENMLAKSFADQPLSANGNKDTKPSHAHIANGKPVHSRIHQYPCPAKCSICVPTDRSIRKALIITNDTGHNHPMPALTKVSLVVKQMYRECVKASRCIGATVSKVDNAQSTQLILKGKTPAAYAPDLHNKQVKRDLVHEVKNELTKPLLERYIHSYITNAEGGICILTCVPFLLKLLDDPGVVAFDDDTTYKCVEGKMNEWELTIFAKVVLCGGNLLVMNTDMDRAQIIGICRSVMKYNVSEYSGIPNDTPPEKNLGVKKIQDWWAHKQMHEWIIPCLVKSQSLIPANVWDSTPSTTNTNEAQHHWTNSLTGIKLSLVEGLESAWNADETVAHEIQASMRTGILTNPNNKVVHRMARNVQRVSAMAGKARESREQSDAETRLKGELAEELEARILSVSSSGRVKTATGKSVRTTSSRKSDNVAAIGATSLIDTSEPQELDMSWDNTSATSTSSVDTMQQQAFPIREVNFIEPASQATADFLNPDFCSTAFMVPPDSAMFPDVTGPPPAPDLSNCVPFSASTRASYTLAYPSFDFYSPPPSISSLPLLPLPLPESLSERSPVTENSTPDLPPSNSPKAHRPQLDGLKPKNILAPGSSCSRAPSTRKRDAKEKTSELPRKKLRTRKTSAMPQANPATGPAVSGGGWGRGNFKLKTFRAAAAVVNLIRTKGGVKSFKSCSGNFGKNGISLTISRTPLAMRGTTTPGECKGRQCLSARWCSETGGSRSLSPGWDEQQMNRDFSGRTKMTTTRWRVIVVVLGAHDDDDGETSSPLASGKTGKRVAAQAAQSIVSVTLWPLPLLLLPLLTPLRPATPDRRRSLDCHHCPSPAFQPSPQRRLNAIQFAKQEAWLDPPYRVALVRALRNIIKADEYVGLVDEDVMRIQWIIHELGEVGIMVFHPLYSNLELDFDV
ncbi:hypothetical protein B0H10DRAFT_1956974 [Mycena sp. CBHHK59/15]|nr:hypothetical protein B0H10DRAFT_1956974 [Mycena sp. CBHHK59/15]